MQHITGALTRLASALSKPPPKVYDPSVYPLSGAISKYLRLKKEMAAERGDEGLAYNKARMESTFREGTYVGMDYNGNKYYEDLNAPYSEPPTRPPGRSSKPLVRSIPHRSPDALFPQPARAGWSTPPPAALGRSRIATMGPWCAAPPPPALACTAGPLSRGIRANPPAHR